MNASFKSADVSVLIVSCDRYSDLWEPFFACFHKYWPDCPYPVYLGSNELACKESGVVPITIGKDIDYSSNLLKMLDCLSTRWVITWIDDRFLARNVDSNAIAGAIGEAETLDAAYLKLIDLAPYGLRPRQSYTAMLPSRNRYRLSMTVALFDRQALMRMLVPGESAWDIERKGSSRTESFSQPFLACSWALRSRPLIRDEHILLRGRLAHSARGFLRREGLAEALKSRRSQTLMSRLYTFAFRFAMTSAEWLRFQLDRAETKVTHE